MAVIHGVGVQERRVAEGRPRWDAEEGVQGDDVRQQRGPGAAAPQRGGVANHPQRAARASQRDVHAAHVGQEADAAGGTRWAGAHAGEDDLHTSKA